MRRIERVRRVAAVRRATSRPKAPAENAERIGRTCARRGACSYDIFAARKGQARFEARVVRRRRAAWRRRRTITTVRALNTLNAIETNCLKKKKKKQCTNRAKV